MNINTLRNPKLALSLYEQYYDHRAQQEKMGERQWVSSYWRKQEERMKVKIDSHGNLLAFTASGIGDMTAKNPLKKIFHFLTQIVYLCILPQRFGLIKLIPKACWVSKAISVHFSYDCFRQMCDFEIVLRHLSPEMKNKHLTILVIGDGCGFLSGLIKSAIPNSTVILVDIGKMLFFQAVNLQKAFPKSNHVLVTDQSVNGENPDFIYCAAENLEKLNRRFSLDIAINICSMAEMNADVIETYYSFLRRNMKKENRFYCCNRESKTLPGGEVLEFKKYPWIEHDRYLVDGKPGWYKFCLNYPSSQHGLKWLGVRVPFVNYFDGEILHRLAILDVLTSP